MHKGPYDCMVLQQNPEYHYNKQNNSFFLLELLLSKEISRKILDESLLYGTGVQNPNALANQVSVIIV